MGSELSFFVHRLRGIFFGFWSSFQLSQRVSRSTRHCMVCSQFVLANQFHLRRFQQGMGINGSFLFQQDSKTLGGTLILLLDPNRHSSNLGHKLCKWTDLFGLNTFQRHKPFKHGCWLDSRSLFRKDLQSKLKNLRDSSIQLCTEEK